MMSESKLEARFRSFTNDQEKSEMLAREMGNPMWLIVPRMIMTTHDGLHIGNLYDPANMAGAKRAIEWGAENAPGFGDTLYMVAYAAWVKGDGVRTLLDELVAELGGGNEL